MQDLRDAFRALKATPVVTLVAIRPRMVRLKAGHDNNVPERSSGRPG
jgi:hypothetical protein